MIAKTKKKKEAKLERQDVISLVEMFAELMNAYGSFAGSLGKIQKENEEAYEQIFSLEMIEKLPELFSKLAEEGPPELSNLFFKIFAKMAGYLPRISKIMELSADDKLILARNLKSLAKDFRKLLEWAEK